MNILAVNPWIIDYAACDFWLKPYGFLVILTYLKKQGIHIDYIDCLNKIECLRHYGRGQYASVKVSNPAFVAPVPRQLRRYGISEQDFLDSLPQKNPDYILLSSSMTYWYLGVKKAAQILRNRYPRSKIILGGIYATLLSEHAKKHIACDMVVSNNKLSDFFEVLGIPYNSDAMHQTMPDLEMFYDNFHYAVMRTSWGCPLRCDFCAIEKLYSRFLRIDDQAVISFLGKYHLSFGIKHFAIYDDAFLFPRQDAKNLLKKIKNLGLDINFHTPNAMHLNFVDREIAELLRETGFINPHFGLDVMDEQFQKTWTAGKIDRAILRDKVKLLKDAGFKDGQVSVYLILGYPGQDLNRLKEDIDYLHGLGIKISLSEFSPIPQTKIFNDYCSSLDEPLAQNNSLFSIFGKEKIKEFWDIKNYTKKLNAAFSN